MRHYHRTYESPRYGGGTYICKTSETHTDAEENVAISVGTFRAADVGAEFKRDFVCIGLVVDDEKGIDRTEHETKMFLSVAQARALRDALNDADLTEEVAG